MWRFSEARTSPKHFARRRARALVRSMHSRLVRLALRRPPYALTLSVAHGVGTKSPDLAELSGTE